jgi:hypothetical protein
MLKIQLKTPGTIKAYDNVNWIKFRFPRSELPVRPTGILLLTIAVLEITYGERSSGIICVLSVRVTSSNVRSESYIEYPGGKPW